MATDIIKKTSEEMQRIMDARAKEVADSTARLEAARKAKEQAEADKTAAIANNNGNAFIKADRARVDAETEIDLHSRRLEYLKAQPMIDRAKGENMAEALYNAAMEKKQNAEALFMEQVQKLADMAFKTCDEITALDKLLETWQRDACMIPNHEPARTLNSTRPIIAWIMNKVINDPHYKELEQAHNSTK